MKLDNLIEDVKGWHRQRMCYKIYGHYFITKKIKTNSFKDDKSFQYFMNTVKNNNQIWDWQYKLFYKMYKGE